MCCKSDYVFSRETTTKMKGIAIIFVVLAHVLNYCVGSSISRESGLLGTGGVWIFLILSGYGLFCSYEKKGIDTKSFWNGKINNVFIPYIVVTFLFYLWLRMSGRVITLKILVKNFICLDFERNIDGTMWYMSFLLLWYIIFFVIFYFDYPKILKILALFVCSYIFHRGDYSASFGECNWQFVTNAYAFPIGVLLGYILSNLKKISIYFKGWNMNIVRNVLFGVCAVIYLCGYLGVVQLSYGQFGVLLFIIIYNSVNLIINKIKILAKSFSLIGKYSYFIYLIEGKCISMILHYNFLNSSLLFVSCLIALIVICVYVYEKIITWKIKVEKGEKHAI